MEEIMKKKEQKRLRLKVLETEDNQSLFFNQELSPEDILERYGTPWSLLSSSAKAEGSLKVGVLNRVMFLPSGIFCPSATPNCRRLCLGHTSGRMGSERAARARDKRAALYLADQDEFLAMLFEELDDLCDEALMTGLTPAVRLNGCSDVPWELYHRAVFDEFSEIEFFDYTKIAARYRSFLTKNETVWNEPWPENYHLCFSFSEDWNNEAQATEFLAAGGTVAVVFWPELPDTWNGFPVVDGDHDDARFLDEPGVVIGLRAKGFDARRDHSGFVQRIGRKRLSA